MNEILRASWHGFVKGLRETLRGYFAPLVAFCRWLYRVTDEALTQGGKQASSAQQKLARHR